MDLRPTPTATPRPPSPHRGWLFAILLLQGVTLGILGYLALAPTIPPEAEQAETLREVASKLRAAGATEEASGLYEDYLRTRTDSESRAKIAFSLGGMHLESGAYEKALRWFYEAESWDRGALGSALDQKIVHCLERLGKVHAAESALATRTALSQTQTRRSDKDPVVAYIGEEPVYRSQVENALNNLPPGLAQGFGTPERREAFLRKYVADELLWRKAKKLEYDQRDEVRRTRDEVLKQLVVGKFVEEEVARKITVDESDLRSFFKAQREHYQGAQDGSDKAPPVAFENVRAKVEADYRRAKLQAAYQRLVDEQLQAANVTLHAERMGGP